MYKKIQCNGMKSRGLYSFLPRNNQLVNCLSFVTILMRKRTTHCDAFEAQLAVFVAQIDYCYNIHLKIIQ